MDQWTKGDQNNSGDLEISFSYKYISMTYKSTNYFLKQSAVQL